MQSRRSSRRTEKLEKMQKQTEVGVGEAKETNISTVNLYKLEQILKISIEEDAKKELSTIVPATLNAYLYNLTLQELKENIKQLIIAYNSQLEAESKVRSEYEYPPQAQMKRICQKMLPEMKIIEQFTLEQLKTLFKTVVDEAAISIQGNVLKDDYLDMHPFAINAKAKEEYDPEPTYEKFMEHVKEKNHALYKNITSAQKQEISKKQPKKIKDRVQPKEGIDMQRPKSRGRRILAKDVKERKNTTQKGKKESASNKRTHSQMQETSTKNTKQSKGKKTESIIKSKSKSLQKKKMNSKGKAVKAARKGKKAE